MSTRVWSRSVSTTGTCRRRANSSASCEAIRPAPTMPTLVTLRARDLSGTPTGRLARRWTRSNAYRLARDSSPMIRSARIRVSAAVPSEKDASLASASSSSALLADGTAPCRRSSSCCLAKNSTPSHMSLSISGRSTVTVPPTTPAAHSSERSRKSAASKISSATPISRACLGRSTFWVSGFCRMTCAAPAMPIRLGSSWLPPQPGTRPIATSGRPRAAAPVLTVR